MRDLSEHETYFETMMVTLEQYNVTLFVVHCFQAHGGNLGDSVVISNDKKRLHVDAIAEFAPNLYPRDYRGLEKTPNNPHPELPYWRGFMVSYDQSPRYPDGFNWRRGRPGANDVEYDPNQFELSLIKKIQKMRASM